jgi:hypothetical protein
LDSTEIDESDLQKHRHLEPRISIQDGFSTDGVFGKL